MSKKEENLKNKISEELKIYYDGECGFCKKLVLFIRKFFLTPETQILPAQSDPEINADMISKNSWVVVDHTGKRFYKFDAMILACKESWILWPFAWILKFPLISKVGNLLYEIVASNRKIASRFISFFECKK